MYVCISRFRAQIYNMEGNISQGTKRIDELALFADFRARIDVRSAICISDEYRFLQIARLWQTDKHGISSRLCRRTYIYICISQPRDIEA